MRKGLCILLALLAVMCTAFAEEDGRRRVFREGETEPFPEGAEVLTIRVCPVMGADCALVTLGEHSMLVDAARETQTEDVLNMLREAGTDSLEYLFISHPHEDHIGGVKGLIEHGIRFGQYLNFFPADFKEKSQKPIQKSTLKAVEEAGIPIRDLDTEAEIPFGSAVLTALRVPKERTLQRMTGNDRSAMLMIQYGSCRALLTADVEKLAQPVLAEVYDLKADVLAFPHHGLVAADKEFLKDVDPEYVYFPHTSYNSQLAQKQLKRYGLAYEDMNYATWGLITLTTDGEKWIVKQEINPELEDYVKRYRRQWDRL